MALFDRILSDHWRTTVIDLGQGLFDQFFKVMAEIVFEDEARQKLIQPIVLFIADSAPFTAQTYAGLRGRWNRPFSSRCTMRPPRSCSSARTFRRRRRNMRRSAFHVCRRLCGA